MKPLIKPLSRYKVFGGNNVAVGTRCDPYEVDKLEKTVNELLNKIVDYLEKIERALGSKGNFYHLCKIQLEWVESATGMSWENIKKDFNNEKENNY